jgi:uncharacterized repeat protein (TIGR01451 family)
LLSHLSRLQTVRLKRLALISVFGAIAFAANPVVSASAATPSADLSTTLGEIGIATFGGYMGYTITVTNHGPNRASNVVITDPTPRYISNLHPTTFYCVGGVPRAAGWCGPLPPNVLCPAPPKVGSPGTVTCTTSSLRVGASVRIIMAIRVGFYFHNMGICDTATATSSTFDPDTANNTAEVCARVN